MALERIHALLEACTTDRPLFPPTELYNEGWLLRLVLDWFSTHGVAEHPLAFDEGAGWFSEALLPSALLRRHKGDPLAEDWTHADGVVGHFQIGARGKADLSLRPDATQLVVLEAKMFSKLSRGVKNASYYDQAARTVACIAELFCRAGLSPSDEFHVAFCLLAPRSQIDARVFATEMDRQSMRAKVERRVEEYGGAKDEWYSRWFEPTLQRVAVETISWEQLIGTIGEHDRPAAGTIGAFYQRCIEFNRSVSSQTRA